MRCHESAARRRISASAKNLSSPFKGPSRGRLGGGWGPRNEPHPHPGPPLEGRETSVPLFAFRSRSVAPIPLLTPPRKGEELFLLPASAFHAFTHSRIH